MIPRYIPPVHSPCSLQAIGQGLRTLWGDPALARARAESFLRQETGATELQLTDSGTNALALAIRLAVADRPGRPLVGLPAWGCYDLATAADTADVGVVLYDVDPSTLGPDWTSFDRALGAGLAAIVVVHAYGVPVDMDLAGERARAGGALLIEDAAQAAGARVGQGAAGTHADLGVLSFGRGKGWTGGGGGALLLNPSAQAGLSLSQLDPPTGLTRQLATIGKLSAQWLLGRPSTYAVPAALPFLGLGRTVYREPVPPTAASGVQAAILLSNAPLQQPEAETRRLNAGRLIKVLEASGEAQVPTGSTRGQPGWLRLPFLPGPALFARIDQPGARRLGVMPSYPTPLSRLAGFTGRLQLSQSSYPGAEELSRQLRTLPTHGLLEERDLHRMEAWISAESRS